MPQDFSQVTFNHKQKQESAAREVASGLRYLIASMCFETLAAACTIATTVLDANIAAMFFPLAIVLLPLAIVLHICSAACGLYGIYSMMDGLGWTWAVTIALMIMALIPYAKWLLLIWLVVSAMGLIQRAGLRFSLFGTLKRAAEA